MRHSSGPPIEICVAGKTIRLHGGDAAHSYCLPSSHQPFGRCTVPGDGLELRQDVLDLTVHDLPAQQPDGSWVPVCITRIWAIWRDREGRYTFAAPRQSPVRQVTIEPDYSSGEVWCGPSLCAGTYPLQGLDNLIVANWLALSGDVILHASGVSVDGRGYCFAGPSGAGKSTVARHVAATYGAVVLGEDQVALRYRNGAFWIYGTPWHLNPDMCLPRGARLQGLFFPDRLAARLLTGLSPGQTLARLMQAAFVPYYRREATSLILDRLAQMVECTPAHVVNCAKDDGRLRDVLLT